MQIVLDIDILSITSYFIIIGVYPAGFYVIFHVKIGGLFNFSFGGINCCTIPWGQRCVSGLNH